MFVRFVIYVSVNVLGEENAYKAFHCSISIFTWLEDMYHFAPKLFCFLFGFHWVFVWFTGVLMALIFPFVIEFFHLLFVLEIKN